MEILTLENTKTEVGYETRPYGDFDLGRCERGSLSSVGEIRTGRRAASSSTRASSAWSSIGLSNDSISCVCIVSYIASAKQWNGAPHFVSCDS